jgi:hypothetical protein
METALISGPSSIAERPRRRNATMGKAMLSIKRG